MDSESTMRLLRRYLFLIALPASLQKESDSANPCLPPPSLSCQCWYAVFIDRACDFHTDSTLAQTLFVVRRSAKLDLLTEQGAQSKQTKLHPVGKKLGLRNTHFYVFNLQLPTRLFNQHPTTTPDQTSSLWFSCHVICVQLTGMGSLPQSSFSRGNPFASGFVPIICCRSYSWQLSSIQPLLQEPQYLHFRLDRDGKRFSYSFSSKKQ